MFPRVQTCLGQATHHACLGFYLRVCSSPPLSSEDGTRAPSPKFLMLTGGSSNPPIVSHLFHIIFYVTFEVFLLSKTCRGPQPNWGKQSSFSGPLSKFLEYFNVQLQDHNAGAIFWILLDCQRFWQSYYFFRQMIQMPQCSNNQGRLEIPFIPFFWIRWAVRSWNCVKEQPATDGKKSICAQPPSRW